MKKTNNKSNHPAELQKALLKWFDRNQRDLPWRKTKDPYSVFVSEMMLQQTQVKTVIPYYERFMRELPDWTSLAVAPEEKVLKLWEGLGYYRRARNLRLAAQMIARDFKGKLPDQLDQIRILPGVGPYSAGAILSIAFQKPIPLVDGNVKRVFSRLFLLKGSLKSGIGRENVWKLAQSLVPAKQPGDYNQALMELGATTCLPENPLCLLCPLNFLCQAAQKGLQNKFPETTPAPEIVEVFMSALLIRNKNKFLLRKRPEKEKWLKGLWEFPSAEGVTFEEALRKSERLLKIKAWRKELQEVRHQITNHRIRLKFFQAPVPKTGKLPVGFKWVSMEGLAKLPFSSAQGKLRKWVQKPAV